MEMTLRARWHRLLALVLLFLAGAWVASNLAVNAAGAQGDGTAAQSADGMALVEIVKVSGLFDEVLVDFVEQRIDKARSEGLTALVFQLNSRGATVSDDRMVALARKIRDSPVPIGVWVGPSGAQARGAAAQLVAVARPGGLAAGAKVGRSGAQILPEDEFGTLWGANGSRFRNTMVKGSPAEEATLTASNLVVAPVLVDFVGDLDGVTSKQVEVNGEARREPNATVRFTALTLGGQLMHTVASPQVAYLLVVIGLALLVFELYTAGIGIAGMVGAVCLALGSYGMVALPVRTWAFVLFVLAFVAFAVDVQTGVPRFWTAVGIVAFVVATLALFDGLSLSWVTMAVGIGGVLLTYLSGMPSMVRTRFSTPTIGRDWMIGEMGLALSAVAPDGTVSVRSARWPARTNRATPIGAGDRIRVVGIEGIILEVEPEHGAARDHRESRGQGVR